VGPSAEDGIERDVGSLGVNRMSLSPDVVQLA
jgi:hypothetical protein